MAAERKREIVQITRGVVPTRRYVDHLPRLHDARLDARVLRRRAWLAKEPFATVLLLPIRALRIWPWRGYEPGFATGLPS